MPPILDNSQDLGVLTLFKCFLGPLAMSGLYYSKYFNPNISNSFTLLYINSMQETEQDPHVTFICAACTKYSNHPALTQCGHLFCWTCLYSQTKENVHCPLCKRIIDIEKTYPVFTQHEEEEAASLDADIPARPNPTYRDKILNPSMANGGMPLGISSLSHNIARRKLVAGFSHFPSIFTNAFNSPEPPRSQDPDYQIYKKLSILSIFLIVAILVILVVLIFS